MWGCGSSSAVCVEVWAVPDSTQLATLGDVASLLGGWLQVSDRGGIKALEHVPRAYFNWDEIRVVPLEMLEEQRMAAM